MSCEKSTAPINISQESVKTECSSKCRYIHSYPKSKCVVQNKGDYLSIQHSDTQNPPASYNSINMDISDIRIYTPSLHTYNDKKMDGEMIINHRGNGNPLLVCIPIKKVEETAVSTELLKSIIDFTTTGAPNEGESVNVNLTNFSLEEFVPKGPFYTYEGTLLYDSCSGTHNYVVYHPSDGYIALNSEYFNKLSQITNNHKYNIKSGPLLFYNKSGMNTSSSGDDGIYIDCQPVGSSGEILYNVNKNQNEVSTKNSGRSMNVKAFFSNPIVIIILSLVGLLGLYKISKVAWDKLQESKK